MFVSTELPCVVFPTRAVLGVASGVAVLESKCQIEVSLMHIMLTLQACILLSLGQKCCCSVLVHGCLLVCANTNHTSNFRFKCFHPFLLWTSKIRS